MQLSQQRIIFSEFFFLHFVNLDSILIFSKKRMILIADVFLNLLIPRDVAK